MAFDSISSFQNSRIDWILNDTQQKIKNYSISSVCFLCEMKSFEALESYLGWKGIFAMHSNYQTFAGSLSKCVYIGSAATFFSTSLWYLATTPRTFDEYVTSFFFWLTSFFTFGWYLLIVRNLNKYLALLRCFDGIVGKRLKNSIRFWRFSNDFFLVVLWSSTFVQPECLRTHR